MSKRYGDTLAVDGLSFTVPPGQVTGFLGPNGAGKSTTMRIMLGLDRPAEGQVLLDGERFHRLSRPLSRVGALLETTGAHRGRRAYDHLLWLARSNRIPAERVREVLALVGLAGVARKRTKGYSLGMSRRLGLAAALLGDPPVLLFDEPFNGLDPEGIVWLRELMKGLTGEGRTVFVSSHLMAEMALTADHLIVIGRGRLLADTSVAGFVGAGARSHVLIRTPEPERMRQILTAAGITVRPAPDGALAAETAEPARVGELAAAHRLVIHEITVRSDSLEEAFMRLTGDAAEHRAEGRRP